MLSPSPKYGNGFVIYNRGMPVHLHSFSISNSADLRSVNCVHCFALPYAPTKLIFHRSRYILNYCQLAETSIGLDSLQGLLIFQSVSMPPFRLCLVCHPIWYRCHAPPNFEGVGFGMGICLQRRLLLFFDIYAVYAFLKAVSYRYMVNCIQCISDPPSFHPGPRLFTDVVPSSWRGITGSSTTAV